MSSICLVHSNHVCMRLILNTNSGFNSGAQNRSHQNLVEFLAHSPSRKQIDNKHSSDILYSKSNQLDNRPQNFSAHMSKNIELHGNGITAMQRSPERKKGGCYDPRTLEYPNDGSRGAVMIGHEWKQSTTVLQVLFILPCYLSSWACLGCNLALSVSSSSKFYLADLFKILGGY